MAWVLTGPGVCIEHKLAVCTDLARNASSA